MLNRAKTAEDLASSLRVSHRRGNVVQLLGCLRLCALFIAHCVCMICRHGVWKSFLKSR